MRKFLYFRSVTDEANDGVTGLKTNAPSSFLFPADSLVAMQPTGDTTLTLYFKPALLTGHSAESVRDTVDLTVTQGDTYEVMDAITSAVNEGPHSDGFVTIADNMVTTDSATSSLNDKGVPATYIHPSISSCAAINVNNPSGGYGIHEYYEVLDIGTGDSGDVCAALSIKIPAQATLIEGAAVLVEKAGSNHGAMAINYHNAEVAFDAAGGGTEWIGADASGNTSIPDADIECGDDAGVVGKAVSSGSAAHVSRGSDATFISVVASEDLSSMTGTPKVGVWIKWMGGAAIDLRND